MRRRRGHRSHAEPVFDPPTDHHNNATARVNNDGSVNHNATTGDNDNRSRYHDHHVNNHDNVDDDHHHDHHDHATNHDNDQPAFRDSHGPAGGFLHEPGDTHDQGG